MVRRESGGVMFHLRLTPKSSRDAIEGWADGTDGQRHLKARVRAVPEDGKANAAIIALLAQTLDVPKSAVRITGGGAARMKRIEIAGDAPRLAAKLEALEKPA